jgi:hypothetical protein
MELLGDDMKRGITAEDIAVERIALGSRGLSTYRVLPSEIAESQRVQERIRAYYQSEYRRAEIEESKRVWKIIGLAVTITLLVLGLAEMIVR